MSNSTPPGQRPPRLRDDEPIALLVAFLAFGAIFFWALTQGREGFNWADFIPGVTGAAPSKAPAVGLSPEPTISATPTDSTVSPTSAAVPDQGTTLLTPASPAEGSAAQPESISPTPSASPAPTTPASSEVGESSPKPTPTTVPGSAIAFSDVPKDYWAYPFISQLSALGIIGGFPDGTFKPNQPVTRAEFAVQIQKAFTKPDQLSTKQFIDIPAGNKWAVAVDKAVKSNFMSGYPDGNFRPDQQVSRTEAVISIVRGLGLQPPADSEALLQPYEDRNQVPDWARSRMATAIEARLFSGDPDTKLLSPNQPATRADIAALLYQALESNK
ncbi:MAG: S-layer homology domain-containing protein [Leptolyngbyaceae cyanobacterium RU_5_1]|nr:S-layer homology domain-containing protein [Leptolyngbyaceae cyanobacterium RU_5_1]